MYDEAYTPGMENWPSSEDKEYYIEKGENSWRVMARNNGNPETVIIGYETEGDAFISCARFNKEPVEFFKEAIEDGWLIYGIKDGKRGHVSYAPDDKVDEYLVALNSGKDPEIIIHE